MGACLDTRSAAGPVWEGVTSLPVLACASHCEVHVHATVDNQTVGGTVARSLSSSLSHIRGHSCSLKVVRGRTPSARAHVLQQEGGQTLVPLIHILPCV